MGDRPEMKNKELSRYRVDLEREVGNVEGRHDRRAVDSVGRAELPRRSSPPSAFQVFHRSLELPLLHFDLSARFLTEHSELVTPGSNRLQLDLVSCSLLIAICECFRCFPWPRLSRKTN